MLKLKRVVRNPYPEDAVLAISAAGIPGPGLQAAGNDDTPENQDNVLRCHRAKVWRTGPAARSSALTFAPGDNGRTFLVFQECHRFPAPARPGPGIPAAEIGGGRILG